MRIRIRTRRWRKRCGATHLPGIFGYSHLLGGYAGGQAEYARVPFADVGPLKIENGFTDEQVLFLSDIFPTGYMAAEACDIQPGDTVAVWGCGPVGQFAIKARLLGAERVIAIDRIPERLRMAREKCGAETINYEEADVHDTLMEMTGGRGPDSCIDAVGTEAHGHGVEYAYDRAKQAMMLESDRPIALREAMMACRKGGTLSVPGVYGGMIDKVPFGAVMNKASRLRLDKLTCSATCVPCCSGSRTGRSTPALSSPIGCGWKTRRKATDMFCGKHDECIKVVLKP